MYPPELRKCIPLNSGNVPSVFDACVGLSGHPVVEDWEAGDAPLMDRVSSAGEASQASTDTTTGT